MNLTHLNPIALLPVHLFLFSFMGSLKGFLGLSATIYTAVYIAIFQPDTITFLLFLALCPSLLALFLVIFINRVPDVYHEEEAPTRAAVPKQARFALVYIVVATIALVGAVSAIWSSEHKVVGTYRRLTLSILLGLLAIMLVVPVSTGPCVFPSRRRALRLARRSHNSAKMRRESHDPESREPLLTPHPLGVSLLI